MQTISCPECGHEIGEDDYSLSCCPICDGFMYQNRLAIKARPEVGKIIQVVKEKVTEHGS